MDVRRLRVPVMPLDEQRRYGAAFRRVHDLRVAAETVGRLAADTARDLATGLTAGLLLPIASPLPDPEVPDPESELLT